VTDDLWTPLTPPNPAAPRPRKHRHSWALTDYMPADSHVVEYQYVCRMCRTVRDERDARRGRNNRARGNAIEREVAHRLGLRRVGQYGGPTDAEGDWLAVQVKSGDAFPERLWTWLQAVPANAAQTAALVVTDAPGPGHRRRALIVLDLDSWVALHGPTEDEE
jgi:hypothetical protein